MATGTDTDLVHGGEPSSDCGWTWRSPRRGEHFRTCSWCGSIHPQDLLAVPRGTGPCAECGKATWQECLEGCRPGAMHSFDPGGWWGSWADWKYGWPHKLYIENLRPAHPGMLHCLGSAGQGPSSPREFDLDWYKVSDLTPELLKIATEDGMQVPRGDEGEHWLGFGTKGTLHAKLYTTHLRDPELPAEVVSEIEQASGLHFWREAEPGEPEAPAGPADDSADA